MSIKTTFLIFSAVLVSASHVHAQYVYTFAGSGSMGSADGIGTAASFNWPVNVGIDSAKNLYVADADNNMIRKIDPSGTVTTFAGTVALGSTDSTGANARFFHPLGIAVDKKGNIYVGDADNNKIRKITPAGKVTTIAGSGLVGSADGPGATATFNYPNGLAVDDAGNVYIADSKNNLIRKIDTGGVVSTLAGNITGGSNDGTGTSAAFMYPTGIAIDKNNNLYVTDETNDMIRKVTSGGVVTTYAGSVSPGSNDDTGVAAGFFQPYGITIDANNNLYVAEIGNDIIRKITAARQVITIAGIASTPGNTDGPLGYATFYNPTGVALDGNGNLFVGDWNNNIIRKIDLTYTGVLSPRRSITLSLYPDPAHDDIMISTKVGDHVIVYNMMGAVINSQYATQTTTNLSVSGLCAGTYSVQTVAKDGTRGYGKFVKE